MEDLLCNKLLYLEIWNASTYLYKAILIISRLFRYIVILENIIILN